MFTITCDDDPWELVFPVLAITWNGGLNDTPLKEENGKFVIDSEYTDPSPTYGGTWRWRFTVLE